jgi:uncharacterized membrane protein YiaA
MIFVSFYSEYEPVNMLVACECGPWKFLARKLARNMSYFALLMFPLFITALVHHEYRLISTGYFLASVNLVAFSILLKYHQYRPGAYSGAHQLLTMLASIISVIFPAVILVGAFNIFLAFGAHTNLKTWLNDRH